MIYMEPPQIMGAMRLDAAPANDVLQISTIPVQTTGQIYLGEVIRQCQLGGEVQTLSLLEILHKVCE